MNDDIDSVDARYGPRRLTVELTNICNLHCDYCLRDEEALYHTPAEFLSIPLLRRILAESAAAAGITEVNFTGGEPTLHPQFGEIIGLCGAQGLKASFVTNGWNFEKLWPDLLSRRNSLVHVAFSLDGITSEAHDRWRGKGSFVRLIRAFSRCHRYGLPFVIKVGIRRDTFEHLEAISMFAARLGAAGIAFAHLMPTSGNREASLALNLEERRRAEEEIALLAQVFKMKVGIDVGYYNIDLGAPCSPLAGTSYNVDYKGRMTLCCNLSGFRGGAGESDVIADLTSESFAAALQKFDGLKNMQLERRRLILSEMQQQGITPDLDAGSPCLLCLNNFHKLSWRNAPQAANVKHSLPVLSI
ncbi:MAG TPA: radical SAM protein [Pyrinomonadaceae bacterium]|nr:radical SAM protein [Pyrinomonadaceae bacterium]